jgi:N-methylhydantoinase A
MRTETARSFSKLVPETSENELIAILDEMAAQTSAELLAEGIPKADVVTQFEIDVRYAGQAFEVPMTIDADTLRKDGITGLIARFDDEHRRLFTFNMETEHEIVNLRAVAMGQALELPAVELPKGDGNPIGAKLRDHQLWMNGKTQAAIIYDRAKLKQADIISGPAIVIEMDSTTLIESDCIGTVDAFGNILITPAA